MFPFNKQQQDKRDDSLIDAQEAAVEKKLAAINRTTATAAKQAANTTRKVTEAITREDIAFNLYYATHSRGEK